jgi:hypothetical protein
MDNTFNIQWAYDYINDPSKVQASTKYANPLAFRRAIFSFETAGCTTADEFAYLLCNPESGTYNVVIRTLMNAFFRRIKELYNFTFDTSPYQDVEHEMVSNLPALDSITLKALRNRIELIQVPLVKQLMTVASCGITMDLWWRTTAIKGNLLYSSGLSILLSDEETELLTSCFNSVQDVVSKVKQGEFNKGDRLQDLHSLCYKAKKEFGFTYGQVLDVWELDRMLQSGFEDIENIGTRLEVENNTCMNHPDKWLEEKRISKETYSKINQSM